MLSRCRDEKDVLTHITNLSFFQKIAEKNIINTAVFLRYGIALFAFLVNFLNFKLNLGSYG